MTGDPARRELISWADYDSGTCSVARTVEVLGDRWTLLVLRDIFNGIRRFDDLSQHLHIARDVLTKRLGALLAEDLIRRVPYREPGSRTRYEYRLTEAGYDLRPVLLALIAWGDKHRAGADGPPMGILHDECGAPVEVAVRCAEGHEIGARTRLRLRPGPGSRRLAPTL
jgi:DNA-binding HxlR family transcriptional regulator